MWTALRHFVDFQILLRWLKDLSSLADYLYQRKRVQWHSKSTRLCRTAQSLIYWRIYRQSQEYSFPTSIQSFVTVLAIIQPGMLSNPIPLTTWTRARKEFWSFQFLTSCSARSWCSFMYNLKQFFSIGLAPMVEVTELRAESSNNC